ncbi:MAG: hypothetical protein FWF83_01585 [Clostridiales bacterium]|nr:hypothetical protein [Clostridiales bacterium]
METVQTQAESPNAEAIWAILREVAERSKETERKISKLGDRFGEMIEHMVRPNLLQRFSELGFVFDIMYPQPWHAMGENRVLAEVDAFLDSREQAMIVEIKSRPSIADIKEHIERMEKIRIWADGRNDKRKFFGAIAGMVMKKNERAFALKSGFFVIEPSGETFTIIAPEGDCSPIAW